MNISIPKIREFTKNSISGRWGQLIPNFLLFLLTMIIATMVILIPMILIAKYILHVNFVSFKDLTKDAGNPYFNLVFNIIISIPIACFSIGFTHFIMEFIKGRTITFNKMFNFGFQKQNKNTVLASISISIISALFSFLISMMRNEFNSNKIVQAIIITVLIVLNIWIGLRLCLTVYIGLDNPNLNSFNLLKNSWQLMRGNIFNLIKVLFKWILFFIIFGILTLGIALIWIAPIMALTTTLFYFTLSNQEDTLNAIPKYFDKKT